MSSSGRKAGTIGTTIDSPRMGSLAHVWPLSPCGLKLVSIQASQRPWVHASHSLLPEHSKSSGSHCVRWSRWEFRNGTTLLSTGACAHSACVLCPRCPSVLCPGFSTSPQSTHIHTALSEGLPVAFESP